MKVKKKVQCCPGPYLTELLLGLPDPDHFRGISNKGRRFPSGLVIGVTVLVLMGRTRLCNNPCDDCQKKIEQQTKCCLRG